MRKAAEYIICSFFLSLLFSVLGNSQDFPNDSIRVRIDTIEILQKANNIHLANKEFSIHDIQTAPGSLGDPMRVLISSADVVSNSDIQAIPIIGGDEADGILTLLDGFPIAFPYRMLGGFSLFNPLTTSKIDLLTMGYSVAYGGYAPSAMSVHSILGYDAQTRIQADISLPLSSVCVNIPVSDTIQCSTKIAFRESHVGLAASLLSGSNRERLDSFLPSMKDAQLFINEMPSSHLYMYQEALLSDEHSSLISLDRTFDYSWQKGFAGAAFLTSSDAISSEHRVSVSHDNVTLSTMMPIDYFGTQNFSVECQFTMVRLCSQIKYGFLPNVYVSAGGEILCGIADIQFQTFSSWLNNRSPVHSDFEDCSAFSNIEWLITENVSTTIGVRGTYFGFIEKMGIEPRGSIEINLDHQTQLNVSIGKYLQAPSDYQILYGFLSFLAMPNQTPRMMLMSDDPAAFNPENNTLMDIDAKTQIFQNRETSADIRFNAYYKNTQSLILPARYPNIFTPLDTLSFEPLQKFQAVKYGIGISCVMNFTPSNLSLTASIFSHHSKIIDNRTGDEYLTAGDIPLVTKWLLQYNPGSWDINILYQYSTGMPTTDSYYIKSTSIIDETNVSYFQIWKILNSSRVPDYHRFDFNITKSWEGTQWKFSLSLSFLNLFDNQNITNYYYQIDYQSPDFTKKTPVANSLPFVPNLNLKYEYFW